MPLSLGKVFVDIVPNMTKFAGQVSKEVGARSKEIGRKAGRAGAVISAGVLVGAKVAISAASDMNESLSKTQVVFGTAGDSIVNWSKTTASSMGIAQTAALDAVSSFAVFGSSAGLTGKSLEGFSKPLVQAAADMASFHNASPEEALAAIRSGLAGEAEPLKRFNILMNESAVNAAAVSFGIVKATKDAGAIKTAHEKASIAQAEYNTAVKAHGQESLEARKKLLAYESANKKVAEVTKGNVPQLTEQQKVLARQKLILQSLGPAAGDFARTSEGAANQQRILDARTKDLTANLGKALLPAYKTLLATGLKIVTYLGKHETATKTAAAVIAAFGATLLVVAGAMKLVTLKQNLVKLGAGKMAKAFGRAMTSVGKAAGKAAAKVAKAVVKLVAEMAKAAAAAVRSAVTQVAAWARIAVAATVSAAKQVGAMLLVGAQWIWMGAKALAGAAMVAAAWILANLPLVLFIAAIALVVILVIKYWGKIKAAFKSAIDKIKGWVATGIAFIKAHWMTILAILTGPIGIAVAVIASHWEQIKAGAAAVWAFIKSGWDALIGFFSGLGGRISGAVSGIWNGLKDSFRSVINTIIGWWNSLSFSVDIPNKIPGLPNSFTVNTPDVPMLATGGHLAPGQLGIVGERGPEWLVGGRSGGTTVVPMNGAGRGGRQAITITNWDEGTGYIETVADGVMASGAAARNQSRRMHR